MPGPPRSQTFTSTVQGHFGEFLQGRLGPDGPLALITVPAPAFRVTATLSLPAPFRLHGAAISRRQAAALCRRLTGAAPRGRLTLRATMPPGGGAGSSTAALLAAAAVLAAASGRPLPAPAALAALCLALEGATDPLMHAAPGRLLWAPRRAEPLDLFPPPPAFEIVGGFLGPGRATDPADEDFADVADLARAWPAASNAAEHAEIATESARRNACHRRGPRLDAFLCLARRHAALGLVAAHTGSALGLLFTPGDGAPDRAAADLRGLGLTRVTRFRTDGPTP